MENKVHLPLRQVPVIINCTHENIPDNAHHSEQHKFKFSGFPLTLRGLKEKSMIKEITLSNR